MPRGREASGDKRRAARRRADNARERGRSRCRSDAARGVRPCVAAGAHQPSWGAGRRSPGRRARYAAPARARRVRSRPHGPECDTPATIADRLCGERLQAGRAETEERRLAEIHARAMARRRRGGKRPRSAIRERFSLVQPCGQDRGRSATAGYPSHAPCRRGWRRCPNRGRRSALSAGSRATDRCA